MQLTSSHPTIGLLYARLEGLLAQATRDAARDLLTHQIAVWESREEVLFVWASTRGGGAFGLTGAQAAAHKIDAFDMAGILMALRERLADFAPPEATYEERLAEQLARLRAMPMTRERSATP